MRVNTNVSALQANNQMGRNVNAQSRSMEKLSSGLRIKRAADDAAGMAISEKMRAKIRGLEQADRNVQDGISVVQTAEGAMEETTNIVQRMRELTVQAASETNSSNEISKIQTELTQLSKEVSRISNVTEFNGVKLLDGSKDKMKVQVGSDKTGNDQIELEFENVKAIGTALEGITLSDTASAQTAIGTLDTQLEKLNTSRSKLGSQQNRLESTSNNLNNSVENAKAAESRIRDVNVASEMMNLSKMNILVQASQSMLSQANQQPQGVLQLLQ